jgi:cbb3-type cytochrome oxidase cytochrome c subunit
MRPRRTRTGVFLCGTKRQGEREMAFGEMETDEWHRK